MKAKSFIVELKPYPFEVFFSFNQHDWAFNQSLKKLGVEDFDDPEFHNPVCLARTSSTAAGATIVRFKNFDKTAFGYGIVAHEIFHVVEMIFDRIGIKHHVKYSSEAYAYQIQYLIEQVYKEIGLK